MARLCRVILLEYEPSDTDLNQATVETKYHHRIEGIPRIRVQRLRIAYAPAFGGMYGRASGMQVRKNADVAPATITASVR